jgi:hypothetical protein
MSQVCGTVATCEPESLWGSKMGICRDFTRAVQIQTLKSLYKIAPTAHWVHWEMM